MKHKTLLLLSIFSLPYAVAQTESPTQANISDKAEIKVTYSSLKEFIKTLEPKTKTAEQAPPIPAAVRSINYLVSLQPNSLAEVTATFAISVFTDEWCQLPILDDVFPISEIEPASTVITPHEGMLCLLTEKSGEYNVTLKFLIAAEVDGSFLFDFYSSVSSQFHLENMDDYEVIGAMKTNTNSYLLSGSKHAVKASPKSSAVARASSWTADSKVLYSIDNEELHAEARIQLTAKQGDPATAATIHLPKDARIISLSGPDLANWKEVSGNQLAAQWSTHGVSRRRLTLRYSVPLPDTDEIWSLSMPYLDKGQPTKGQIAVHTPPELQLSSPDKTIVSDPHIAPDWMRQYGLPFIVKLPEVKQINLSCQRLSQMQIATATIRQALFTTQIVADGSTLSTGEITVEHNEPEAINLSLPAESKILTCSIDGVLSSPIILSDGSMQLNLSNKQKASKQTSKVLISFTSKLDEIKPIEGKLSLALPSTPLFIHQLAWHISLPPLYEVTALEGNLEFSANTSRKSAAHQPNMISLIKQLSRNQAAQTDIFYRKKNL